MAKIGTWTLNELKLKELMRIAVKPQDLAHVRPGLGEVKMRWAVLTGSAAAGD